MKENIKIAFSERVFPPPHDRGQDYINQRSVIMGEVFTATEGKLYSRWGDWYDWTMVGLLSLFVGIALRSKIL